MHPVDTNSLVSTSPPCSQRRSILVLAAALLAAGWIADHLRQERRLVQAEQAAEGRLREIEQSLAARERLTISGAPAGLVEELTAAGVQIYVRPCGARVMGAECCEADVLKLAGLPSLDAVSIPACGISESAVARLRDLPQLKSLHLRGSWVTGNVLKELAPLEQLESLSIDDANIYDEDLVAIEPLVNLTYVRFHNSPISSAGLKHLQGMKSLRELCLSSAPVSDRGIPTLATLSGLTNLDLRGTQITADGLAELQGLLPGCTVLHD